MNLDKRTGRITTKLILMFACVVLLLFSLPSSLISTNAMAQNSTSSNNDEDSSDSQSQESSDATSDSSSDNSEADQSASKNKPATTNSTSSSEQSSNSTSSETSEQSADMGNTGASKGGESSNSTSTSEQNNNSTGSTEATNEQQQNATSTTLVEAVQSDNEDLVDVSDEQLILSTEAIERSFSYSLLEFEGETAADITVTIRWNVDGTTEISDSRGASYTISILEIPGTFTLLYNSTNILQKVIGPILNYEVHWTRVENQNGDADQYKFTIVGTSLNNSNIKFKIDSDTQLKSMDNGFFIDLTSDSTMSSLAAANLDPTLDWTPAEVKEKYNSIAPIILPDSDKNPSNGLGLDWSDAVRANYEVQFDTSESLITIPVMGNFVIDPATVTTVNTQISPSTTDYFSGEKRTLYINNITYAFYYDGSDIVYRTSLNEGFTWDSPISLGTGTIAADTFSWTVITTTYNGDRQITLLYWKLNGGNHEFYSKRGTVSQSGVSWSSPVLIGYTWSSNCNGQNNGACAGVTAATDTNGYVYATFRWISGGATHYSYRIMRSQDAGINWEFLFSQVDNLSTTRPAMALSRLSSGNMLFVYALYGDNELKYRVLNMNNNPPTWTDPPSSTVSSGMCSNTIKQISADSDSSNAPYVAFLGGTGCDDLKIARWTNTGAFNTFETADSTLSHKLPTITRTPSNDVIHVFTLASNKVYDIKKMSGSWQTPSNPFGTSFSSPEQLTGTTNYDAVLWLEGTSAPYNLRFAVDPTTIASTAQTLSPGISDYFEGERRFVQDFVELQPGDFERVLYMFYYDGSNVVYKTSTDGGASWSSSATSTGTGTISSDAHRWSVATVGAKFVLAYWNSDSTQTTFKVKLGETSTGTTISWATQNLFSKSNYSGCNGGVCAAAAISSDTLDLANIYIAFRYVDVGAGTYYYSLWNSADAGDTWTTSGFHAANTAYRPAITLAPLANGDVLFSYGRYDSSSLFSRTYDGTTISSLRTHSGVGWSVSTSKQLSSDSDANGNAYVTYVSGGTTGDLRVVSFEPDGDFITSQTIESTLSHSLPAMRIDGDSPGIHPIIRIYTITEQKIYETLKDADWIGPFNPFGTTFSSPNQLTATEPPHGAVWKEGDDIKFGMEPGISFRADWEIHDGQDTIGGTRANIKVMNPNASCIARDKACLFEGVTPNYGELGALGSGWIKYNDGSGLLKVYLAFFKNDHPTLTKTYTLLGSALNTNNLPKVYEFEVSKTSTTGSATEWKRVIRDAGAVVHTDTLTMTSMNQGHPRVSAWTDNPDTDLGLSTPAEFTNIQGRGLLSNTWADWNSNVVDFWCAASNEYIVHYHGTPPTIHMGPPYSSETNSCTYDPDASPEVGKSIPIN